MLGCTLSTPPKNISNLPLLWTFVARFLQPGLTSSTIFHKSFTRFSYCQPYKIFKHIIGQWLETLETSQKSLLKIFCYNNKVTWNVEDFQKLSKRNLLHPSASILYKHIYFSFFSSLKPCNTQNVRATHQIFCVPDVKNKKSLNPILYYIITFLD